MSAFGSRRGDLLISMSSVGLAKPCSISTRLKKLFKVESIRFILAGASLAKRNDTSKSLIVLGSTSVKSLPERNSANLVRSLRYAAIVFDDRPRSIAQ